MGPVLQRVASRADDAGRCACRQPRLVARPLPRQDAEDYETDPRPRSVPMSRRRAKSASTSKRCLLIRRRGEARLRSCGGCAVHRPPSRAGSRSRTAPSRAEPTIFPPDDQKAPRSFRASLRWNARRPHVRQRALRNGRPLRPWRPDRPGRPPGDVQHANRDVPGLLATAGRRHGAIHSTALRERPEGFRTHRSTRPGLPRRRTATVPQSLTSIPDATGR